MVDHSLGGKLTNAEIADQLRMHIGEVKMAKSMQKISVKILEELALFILLNLLQLA